MPWWLLLGCSGLQQTVAQGFQKKQLLSRKATSDPDPLVHGGWGASTSHSSNAQGLQVPLHKLGLISLCLSLLTLQRHGGYK